RLSEFERRPLLLLGERQTLVQLLVELLVAHLLHDVGVARLVDREHLAAARALDLLRAHECLPLGVTPTQAKRPHRHPPNARPRRSASRNVPCLGARTLRLEPNIFNRPCVPRTRRPPQDADDPLSQTPPPCTAPLSRARVHCPRHDRRR